MDFDARVERSRLVVLFVVRLFDICSSYDSFLYFLPWT